MKKDRFTAFVVKYTDTLWEVMVLYLITIFIASISFSFTEGIHFGQAIWFSFVTATSTGYGDFTPHSFGGQLTAVALMHSTIFVIIPLAVARILSVVMHNENEFTHDEQEEIKNLLKQLAGERNANGARASSEQGSGS